MSLEEMHWIRAEKEILITIMISSRNSPIIALTHNGSEYLEDGGQTGKSV